MATMVAVIMVEEVARGGVGKSCGGGGEYDDDG